MALIISIIVNLLSISSILLVASMFVSDWVWIKPEKDKNVIDVTPEPLSKEEKIAELRKKKEDGLISEEQFQEELVNLLYGGNINKDKK